MVDIKITDLNGLGPKSQSMLARAGITTVHQLEAMGSVAAYVQTQRHNKNVSLNLLWALESALSGENWQTIAKHHRTSLLLALEEYTKTPHNIPGLNNNKESQ